MRLLMFVRSVPR